MVVARSWQKHNGLEGEFGQMAHRPRSLNSMLADSRRAPSSPHISKKTMEVPEGELESESQLIALGQDVAPLFQACPLLTSPARRMGSRELLTDLFPTGFTRNTLSSLATAAAGTTEADEYKPTSARTAEQTEPELKGRQVWACLMPKAVPATAVASSNDASDVDRETELRLATESVEEEKHVHHQPSVHTSWSSSHQPNGCSEQHQPNYNEVDTHVSKPRESDASAEINGLESSNANATAATGRRADLGAPVAIADPAAAAARRRTSLVSDRGGHGHGVVANTETSEGTWRERESDLKHALDRLVPRLMQSQERVSEVESLPGVV